MASDAKPSRLRSRRTMLLLAGGAALVTAGGFALHRLLRFPPDTTPEGAYLRVTFELARGNVKGVFSYLEDAAQHAAFTIRDYRKKASDLVAAHYPEPDRARLLDEYRTHAEAPDGSDVWVDLATSRGWTGRLRRDLSGIASTEIDGDRATITTVRGTRYPFRKRDNGMWGLTLFTADMVALAERAARDLEVVTKAADDYAHAGG
ncbi:MAG TPA: hypothetical protein VL400_26290 [Polyangiaceae bacterium]|nr:hypothetical protein [Polyangiaceae bacterium]